MEAFHSIVQREVIVRFEFDSFYHAKHTLAAHRSWYDNKRNHRSIGTTPKQRWDENIGINLEKRSPVPAATIKAERQTINNQQTEINDDKLQLNSSEYYTINSKRLSN